MNNGILYFPIVIILFNCCQPNNPLSKSNEFEFNKVERCRKDWTFRNLHDTLEITLLMQDGKGKYDLVSWPNFFIGISPLGDTLGIVEYDCEKIFKKQVAIKFLPATKDTSISNALDSGLDEPIFKVSKKSKENDLYCSVKIVYYGKLMEE